MKKNNCNNRGPSVEPNDPGGEEPVAPEVPTGKDGESYSYEFEPTTE